MSSFDLTIHMNLVRIHTASENYLWALARAQMALAAANRIGDVEARKDILRTINKLRRIISRERIRAKTEQLRQELAHA